PRIVPHRARHGDPAQLPRAAPGGDPVTGEPTTGDPVIECHDVRKRFGRTEGLKGLDLVLRPGEIVGFIGPNGAGKTTTLRILAGLVFRSSGQVRVAG